MKLRIETGTRDDGRTVGYLYAPMKSGDVLLTVLTMEPPSLYVELAKLGESWAAKTGTKIEGVEVLSERGTIR